MGYGKNGIELERRKKKGTKRERKTRRQSVIWGMKKKRILAKPRRVVRERQEKNKGRYRNKAIKIKYGGAMGKEKRQEEKE